MLKSFNQGSTLPADFTQPSIKKRGNYRVSFFRPVCVCVCLRGDIFVAFFVDVGCPGDHFGGNFGVLEHPEAPRITPWIPRCLLGAIWMIFCTFRWRKASPLFSTFLFICVCRVLLLLFAVLKKLAKKAPKRSARRASGGFPSRRELIFHFCSRTQKGLQNGSQNGAFWEPKSPLYYFLEDLLRADF